MNKYILTMLCMSGALFGQSFQRSFAVVVGITNYQAIRGLPNATNDAQSIAGFLKSQNYQVTELYNQDAKRVAVIDALDNLALNTNPHDRVLFFFAGHGYTETRGAQDWGYIVPYDGKPPVTSSLIGMEELRIESEKMGNARHQLFLIDSCYGGSIGSRSNPLGVDPRIPNYISEITKRVAREALTAGGKDQQVEDGAINGHSRFTSALLEALKEGKADLNSDGYITFSELAAYVLPRATSSLQTPAPAWLPGHGLGEYWFSSETTRTMSNVALRSQGASRDSVASSASDTNAPASKPTSTMGSGLEDGLVKLYGLADTKSLKDIKGDYLGGEQVLFGVSGGRYIHEPRYDSKITLPGSTKCEVAGFSSEEVQPMVRCYFSPSKWTVPELAQIARRALPDLTWDESNAHRVPGALVHASEANHRVLEIANFGTEIVLRITQR